MQIVCQSCQWPNVRLHIAQPAQRQHVGWQGTRVLASGTCTWRTGLRVTKALAWSHRVGSGSACASTTSSEQLVGSAAGSQMQCTQPTARLCTTDSL